MTEDGESLKLNMKLPVVGPVGKLNVEHPPAMHSTFGRRVFDVQ